MRRILHMDMDAFFAAVEQRDRPELRGKPVIVGGKPHSRGVVATCSYEARRFGVHSAMPASQAHRLCPLAIFVKPRFEVYKAVSAKIMTIFRSYTQLVEPLSLDEAYLDVSDHPDDPVHLAKEIQERIAKELQLSVTAGVSYNKFLAKMASSLHKPHGLTVVRVEEAQTFLAQLPVDAFLYVGSVTAKRLHGLGVHTGEDLQALNLHELHAVFGQRASFYYDLVRGIDHRSVQPNRVRQSLGKETTLATDIEDDRVVLHILQGLAEDVAQSLQKRRLWGKVVVLKIKFHNFQVLTRQMALSLPTQDAEEIFTCIDVLWQRIPLSGKKVRLLGVNVADLVGEQQALVQPSLFGSFREWFV